MRVCLDPGHETWTERTCINCGKNFVVRTCYTKRGQGKFCSTSCGTTYRNKTDNPSWKPETREKISKNHADVSGENNPMYGKRGADAPGYIDGRRLDEDGNKISGDIWRVIALHYKKPVCESCGEDVSGIRFHVHHRDENRKNNNLENLMISCVRCHNFILHQRKRNSLGQFARG